MAKDRAAKKAISDKLAEKFNKANGAIIAQYRGLTAEELAKLRRDIRAAGGEFHVVKNRLAVKAIDNDAKETAPLRPMLKGPIGVAFMYKDVAAGAKAILEFGKTVELFVVGGGLLDHKALSSAEVKAISELPSKEVLLSKILGSLMEPHRQLVTVLSGVSRKLVYAISAIKDTKS